MNQDIFAGNWKQFEGKLQEKWGKLTNDDLTVAAGKRDQIIGKLQAHYGLAKEEAHKQLDEFEKSLMSKH